MPEPPPPRRRRLADLQAGPVRAHGLTRFSETHGDPRVNDTLALIRIVCSIPPLYRLLASRFGVDTGWGRPRLEIDWFLAYLAWVMSGRPALQRWWSDNRSNRELWRAVTAKGGRRTARDRRARRMRGQSPCLETLRKRFIEMEENADAFEEAAGWLMRRVYAVQPELFDSASIDSTEAESHVRPHHACRPEDHCPDPELRHLGRVSAERARKIRHKETQLDLDEGAAAEDDVAAEPKQTRGTKRRTPPGESALRTAGSQREIDPDGGVYYRSGGHRWWIRDAEAGLRFYAASDSGPGKCWIGMFHTTASAIGVDAPLTTLVFSASENEASRYQQVLERIEQNLGALPLALIADAGYYQRATMRHNTKLGIVSVFAPRRSAGSKAGDPMPTGDGFDAQGDPVCRACGGPTVRAGHSNAAGRSRIFFHCELPQGPDCEGKQSISCARDERRLLPISRRSRAYRALARAGRTQEHQHIHARQRHVGVAAKDVVARPKRLGIGCQQLRASAALFLTWLRLCLRQGWLGAKLRPVATEPLPVDATEAASVIEARRRKRERDRLRRRRPPPPDLPPA